MICSSVGPQMVMDGVGWWEQGKLGRFLKPLHICIKLNVLMHNAHWKCKQSSGIVMISQMKYSITSQSKIYIFTCCDTFKSFRIICFCTHAPFLYIFYLDLYLKAEFVVFPKISYEESPRGAASSRTTCHFFGWLLKSLLSLYHMQLGWNFNMLVSELGGEYTGHRN